MEITTQVEAFAAASRWDLEKMNGALDELNESELNSLLNVLIVMTRATSARVAIYERKHWLERLAAARTDPKTAK